MKIQNLVLLGGVVLIILAIVILSLSYYQGVENTEIIKIEAGSAKTYPIHLSEGNHVLLLTSDKNFTYYVIDSDNQIVHNGTNERSAEVHLNEGSYTIKLENSGSEDISVAVTVAKEEVMNNLILFTYLSGGLCSIGMLVIVIGIALILWNRKKEERIYSR